MGNAPIHITVESGGIDWTAIATFVLAGLTLAVAGVTGLLAIRAKQSLEQATLVHLFSTFDLASHAGLAHPHVFYDVHGLSRNKVDEREARNLAYLGLLIDAFQHFYHHQFKGDFRRMEVELRARSTYLNRLLAHAPNRRRWQVLRGMFYGELDRAFLEAMDSLISLEEGRDADADMGASD